MATALNGKLVTVFGGSGFVGRHVIRALATKGYRVRAAVRRPDLAEHLQPLGGVGQIMPIQANLRYKDSVERAISGADAVINLVGILHEAGKQTFDAVQAQGAELIAQVASEHGIKQFVHMSAIGANPDSSSSYARTKAAGEAAVLKALPHAVILRPSIIFGPEDDFFNRFGSMACIMPTLPLIGGGKTKFQPVFVGDVAEAVLQSLEGTVATGCIYELGGPQVLSFKECLEKVLEVTRRKRVLMSLPFGIARMQARILQMLPNPMLTIDQLELLKTDNIVSKEALDSSRTLKAFDLEPRNLDAILPTYMDKFRPKGQYDAHLPQVQK
ncbi:complex I NDUFA9 subunit family protein [Flexibacterium corallicola]|uniref:complex I NDUFA9 subunit family protein n=1 Tax=Flexibacterium corallicola TaxID=3037259 RepID=UPI00286F1448|nr:complex I NDUFA9 subunit family protein [Pseudovibrio sp. M1P-2-3]